MRLLRFLTLLVLTVWVGGLAVLGAVAAPAIFDVLGGLDPAGGRDTAGLVFGTVFAHFQWLAWALAVLLIGLMGTRAALGPRPRRFAWRMWAIVAMLAMSLTTGLYIAPRIDAIRADVDGPVAALPDADARKAAFGQLHGASNGLMVVTLLAGVWLIWVETRDDHR